VTAPRAGTWLGDAAEVIRVLGLTDEEDVRKIAPMLGLAYAGEPERAREPDVIPDTTPPDIPPETPATAAGTGSRVSRLRALAPLALPSLEPIDTQVSPEPGPEPAGLALPEEHETPAELPFRPLLPPRTAAGVAAALVRTWGPGSRIDEHRTVAELARGRPVRVLPRRPRPSLYRGAQVLVDQGEALDPYGRDQQAVVKLVQRVVGPRMTPVGTFENCPSRGIWLLPRSAAVRGRPVLVLTDLGLGGPQAQPDRASAAEWIRYARGAARAGSPVIALIPYPPGQARQAIRRRIAVAPWDRASVSAVQRARRRVS
jgi:hypothetical protein